MAKTMDILISPFVKNEDGKVVNRRAGQMVEYICKKVKP